MSSTAFPYLSAACAISLAGCATRYVAPEPAAPHASLLLRVRYHGAHDGLFSESITINDRELAMPRPAPERATDAARLVRLRPEAVVVHVSTEFRRYETGFATGSQSPSMSCASTPVEASGCSGSDPRAIQHVLQAVPTATCTAVVTVSPSAGDELRIDYDFFGDAQCAATCVRAVRRSDGSVTHERCR